jgi:hypothetical protein
LGWNLRVGFDIKEGVNYKWLHFLSVCLSERLSLLPGVTFPVVIKIIIQTKKQKKIQINDTSHSQYIEHTPPITIVHYEPTL